jgi:hypothetical protein
VAVEEEWGLVFPFVVCRSNGGPYDDEAFVAGYQAGQISKALAAAAAVGADRCMFTVRTDLVPQLDLIAMHYGFSLEAKQIEETEGYPAMPEWSGATFLLMSRADRVSES